MQIHYAWGVSGHAMTFIFWQDMMSAFRHVTVSGGVETGRVVKGLPAMKLRCS